jgi:hypothetical protein
MIDRIIVPPSVHMWNGVLVLASTLLVSVWLIWLLVRRQPPAIGTSALLLLPQLALMVQALLGIKLLDQGMGVVQLSIHYLGGLAPLLFYIVTYWFPARDGMVQVRNRAIASGAAFAFAFMAFSIGQMYVRGGA